MSTARNGRTPADIVNAIEKAFGYDISTSVDEIREYYEFDVTCQGTVPEALRCYLEADGFEDTIRYAISIGGDSDTLAAIAGSFAEATWGVPEEIGSQALDRLDADLLNIYQDFRRQYSNRLTGV